MPSSLIKKLRLHTIQQALVLKAPEGYLNALGELPAELSLSENIDVKTKYEFVQVFALDRAEYEQLLPNALEAIEYDGLLWICYPKKNANIKSDLSRNVIWEMTKGTGIRPVSQVSIDETWSALRFRPDDAVGK